MVTTTSGCVGLRPHPNLRRKSQCSRAPDSLVRLTHVPYSEHSGVILEAPPGEEQHLFKQRGGQHLDRTGAPARQAFYQAPLSEESVTTARFGYAISVKEKDAALVGQGLFVSVAGVSKHAKRRTSRLK